MSTNTIALAKFRQLMEHGGPLNIIDVRTPGEFARVHATGARLIPLDELDPAAIAIEYPNRDDPIYVICQSGGRAAKACQRLQKRVWLMCIPSKAAPPHGRRWGFRSSTAPPESSHSKDRCASLLAPLFFLVARWRGESIRHFSRFPLS